MTGLWHLCGRPQRVAMCQWPWQVGVTRHFVRPNAVEFPLFQVQRSAASHDDKCRVPAAAVIGSQNLSGCSQPEAANSEDGMAAFAAFGGLPCCANDELSQALGSTLDAECVQLVMVQIKPPQTVVPACPKQHAIHDSQTRHHQTGPQIDPAPALGNKVKVRAQQLP